MNLQRVVWIAGALWAGSLEAAAAQRPSRDWSPEDRTLIGDFSHIRTVAAASDRVFVTSESALLVRLPHFERWEGPFRPGDPRLLEGAFASIVDPLDNSLWLARHDGWIHYEPELDLWSSGRVPGNVQGMAFDLSAPLAGLLLQTSAGWVQVARGSSMVTPAEPPAQPLLRLVRHGPQQLEGDISADDRGDLE